MTYCLKIILEITQTIEKGNRMSSDTRKILQARLTDEQEEMKQYLLGKGIKLSKLLREFLVQLYGIEKNKEAVNSQLP